MRLSLFAAKFAACVPFRCAQINFRTAPSFIRTFERPSTVKRGEFIPSRRRHVGHIQPRELSTEEKGRVSQETGNTDIIKLRALDAEVQNDPARTLNGEERKVRESRRTQRFIDLLRTVPNSVAIVTTRRQDLDDSATELVGATISSFKSVSIKPEPYISFNLAQLSRTYKVIKEHKYFCITLPQNDKAGQKLASSFASKTSAEIMQPQEDGAKVLPHFWHLAFEGGRPADMNYPPAAVKTFNIKGAKTNGLAFAFLCEYENSITAGDHAVITAKLLPAAIESAFPWGKDDDLGSSFATSYITLAYAHGMYGNREAIGGLDQSWKRDDPSAGQPATDLKPEQQLELIKFYENRLQVIEDIVKSRSGPIIVPDPYPTNVHKRARLLPPQRLNDYRQYYQNRLLEFYTAIKAASSHAANPLANVKQVVEPFVEAQDIGSQLSDAVIRKASLSLEELEHEEKVYLARLEALNWIDPEQVTSSQTVKSAQGNSQDFEDRNSDRLSDRVAWSSMAERGESPDNPANERSKLIDYFSNRLQLVHQAKKQKQQALVHPETPKSTFVNQRTQEERRRAAKKFIGSREANSLTDLIREYRKVQVEITETRLARIQSVYQSDQHNQDLLTKLEERLTHFELRLNLLAQILAERYERGETLSSLKNQLADLNGSGKPDSENLKPIEKREGDKNQNNSLRIIKVKRREAPQSPYIVRRLPVSGSGTTETLKG